MSTETQHLLLEIMQYRLEADIALLASSPPPRDSNVETELCHRMIEFLDTTHNSCFPQSDYVTQAATVVTTAICNGEYIPWEQVRAISRVRRDPEDDGSGLAIQKISNEFLETYFRDRDITDVWVCEQAGYKGAGALATPREPDPLLDPSMDKQVLSQDPSPEIEVEDCDLCRRFGKQCEWSDEYLACIRCHEGHRRCSRKLARRARYWTERTHDLCVTEARKLDVPALADGTETMARLELLTERVLEIETDEEDCLGIVSEQLDDVLQEIHELSDEMDSHERLQEMRWKVFDSLSWGHEGTVG